MELVRVILGLLGVYLVAGMLFAMLFVVMGVQRIDPHAAHGSWGFRVLIIPGTIFLWPLLARRWFAGRQQPPEEQNVHRSAARSKQLAIHNP